jgi:hypothetical protein
MLINTFEGLNAMAGKEVWKWVSTYDFINEAGELDYENYLSPAWIKETLSNGNPILVGWNAFGGHWQAIIGYDDMGTELTADDVLIMADSYDSTDHLNDGYNIQSYERLVYDWTQDFDRDFGLSQGYGMPVMFVPYPADYEKWDYSPTMGGGLMAIDKDVWNTRVIAETPEIYIGYGDTAAGLGASAYETAKEQAGDNGLAGPASSQWFKQFEVKNSPYYAQHYFYGIGSGLTDTLTFLDGFKTAQQASEWTCGPSTARMVMNWFGMENIPSEFTLSQIREDDKEGATTLDGMKQIFASIGWSMFTTDDLDEDYRIGGRSLYDGAAGLIPYFLRQGIPVMIGWDEWGGHWQAIVGYDDMGTEATQDDVIILADPYDTTDHLQDGYVIEGYERLLYGWGAAFDERGSDLFIIAAPKEVMEAAIDW